MSSSQLSSGYVGIVDVGMERYYQHYHDCSLSLSLSANFNLASPIAAVDVPSPLPVYGLLKLLLSPRQRDRERERGEGEREREAQPFPPNVLRVHAVSFTSKNLAALRNDIPTSETWSVQSTRKVSCKGALELCKSLHLATCAIFEDSLHVLTAAS